MRRSFVQHLTSTRAILVALASLFAGGASLAWWARGHFAARQDVLDHASLPSHAQTAARLAAFERESAVIQIRLGALESRTERMEMKIDRLLERQGIQLAPDERAGVVPVPAPPTSVRSVPPGRQPGATED